MGKLFREKVPCDKRTGLGPRLSNTNRKGQVGGMTQQWRLKRNDQSGRKKHRSV